MKKNKQKRELNSKTKSRIGMRSEKKTHFKVILNRKARAKKILLISCYTLAP